MLFLVLSVAICLGGWWFISYTDRRDMEEAEREAHKHVCGKNCRPPPDYRQPE